MNGNEPRAGSAPERRAQFSIGEIASRAGVSVDTVRHYERRGLIGPASRTESGYRLFAEESVRRILEIRAAVELGFGLDELAEAIAARERGRPACHSVRELLAAKAEELDRRIAELEAKKARVAKTLAGWDRRLAATPPGAPAHLLRSIEPGGTTARSGRTETLRDGRSRVGSQSPGKDRK